MAQEIVPASLSPDYPSPNPRASAGVISTPNDPADIIAALSNEGGGFSELVLIQTPEAEDEFNANYELMVKMGEINDPGVDTDHKVVIRAKFQDFGDAGSGYSDCTITLILQAPSNTGSPAFQKQWVTALDAPHHWSGDLYTGDDTGVDFVELDLPLSEEEVAAFRAAGGYTNCAIYLISICVQDGSSVSDQYDLFSIVAPGTGPDPVIEITSDAGVIVEGGLPNYQISAAGVEAGNVAGLYWTNEIIGNAGIVTDASGIYGSNEIVSTAGLIAGAGGRDFYLVAPDISGIYVLVPGKRYDTWYKRTGIPDTTEDVKIPDPFVSLAFVPEDD